MLKHIWLFLFVFVLTDTSLAQPPDISTLQIKAPEIFRASFKTSKGEFVVEAYRKWSPQGVDRLYQLIKTGFYNNNLLFRVEPAFVIQFGINNSEKINRFWDPKKLLDEPAKQKNTKGIISYARGGRNDRATQIFINMADNPKLDTMTKGGLTGFTPIAKIIRGMQVLTLLNARYGRKPVIVQDSLYKYGNRYFEKHFSGLDRIISARIIP